MLFVNEFYSNLVTATTTTTATYTTDTNSPVMMF